MRWHLMDGRTYTWLNRPPLEIQVPDLRGKKVLITGSSGYIGVHLSSLVEELGGKVIQYDLPRYSVMDAWNLHHDFRWYRPELVIHLAAHKYATTAEEIPTTVAELNIIGTQNMIDVSTYLDIPLTLASTCKAADPCTAYGASKLIAERVVLNYEKGNVFRLVNVIGSTGSVIDIWDHTPANEPLVVHEAKRFYISPHEACKFFLATTALPHGVYAPWGLDHIWTSELAKRYSTGFREIVYKPLRRGDRPTERILAEYEASCPVENQPNLLQIFGPWEA